ncbi:MAG: prealbumin-like fold domain-containing protein [Ruminococcus sp.]
MHQRAYSNAIFELQDSNGKVFKSGIKTKANGETDEIQLSKQLDKTVFDLYVKYKLVETTAPSGYKTGNSIEFYFTDYSKSADELVKMGLQDAIAVFSNSTVVGTIEISNKKAEDVEEAQNWRSRRQQQGTGAGNPELLQIQAGSADSWSTRAVQQRGSQYRVKGNI